jgi:hypothetical protein
MLAPNLGHRRRNGMMHTLCINPERRKLPDNYYVERRKRLKAEQGKVLSENLYLKKQLDDQLSRDVSFA